MTSSRQLPRRISPRPVRATIRRVAASQAAADLRRNWVFLLGTLTILMCAFLVGIASEPSVVTSHPSYPLATPADITSPCGDFCGTDAGLLHP